MSAYAVLQEAPDPDMTTIWNARFEFVELIKAAVLFAGRPAARERMLKGLDAAPSVRRGPIKPETQIDREAVLELLFGKVLLLNPKYVSEYLFMQRLIRHAREVQLLKDVLETALLHVGPSRETMRALMRVGLATPVTRKERF